MCKIDKFVKAHILCKFIDFTSHSILLSQKPLCKINSQIIYILILAKYVFNDAELDTRFL